MLLENKTAIVHGGAGAIGSAVARAYAREGAHVHLTGRTEAALEQVAESIRGDGGTAHVAQLDALDGRAVDRHAGSVAEAAAGIDICFNATSNDDVQGTRLAAAARQMAPRRSGAILVMAGGREAIPQLGGSHVAWSALAGLCRQLAAELAPHRVRVLWLLSPGSQGSDPAGDADTDALMLPQRPSTPTSPTSPSSPPRTGPGP